MRCPKCKFISFDDLSNCAKCAHDLSALATELNGTCTETHLEFFLGPVVQTPNFDENEFSDSKSLPPIDHGDINFDDTSSGGFAAIDQRGEHAEGIDFDESVGVPQEDDISIELGDIMPIDLDQLDYTSVIPEDSSNTLSLDNDQNDVTSSTTSLGSDHDLNLTDEFADINLDLDFNEELSDLDLDDTNMGVADDNILAVDSEDISVNKSTNELDFDDDLTAELSGSADDLDATATLTKSAGGFDTINLSSTGEFSGDESSLDLDESLISELTDDDDDSDNSSSSSGSGNYLELSEQSIEDLTGEFSSIPEGEEPELSSLDFSDIDVSDLVSTSESAVQSETNNSFAAIAEDDTIREDADQANEDLHDLTGPETKAGDTIEFSEIDEIDLDHLDESDLATLDTGNFDVTTESDRQLEKAGDELPEADFFVEDEDNEGPPDLPS